MQKFASILLDLVLATVLALGVFALTKPIADAYFSDALGSHLKREGRHQTLTGSDVDTALAETKPVLIGIVIGSFVIAGLLYFALIRKLTIKLFKAPARGIVSLGIYALLSLGMILRFGFL